MKTNLCLACCLLAGVTEAVQGQPLVLEPYTVRDPVAVHQDALTFLKPKSWKVAGGMKWYPEQTHQVCLEVTVRNPDTLEQIETMAWCYLEHHSKPVIPMKVGFNYMGNLIHPPIEDPREVIDRITIPQLRPKARIVSSQDLPDAAKMLSGLHAGARVRASRVRIEYMLGGTTVEEDIYLSIFTSSARITPTNTMTLWGPAWPPFSLRAEKGKLDESTPLMLAVVNSGQLNPRWYGEVMYVQNLFKKRMTDGIWDAVRLSRHIRENSDAIFKMYSDSYWSRQKSQDRIFNNFSGYIRGVTTYHDPHRTGCTVQLPNTHRYAWSSATGGYILSDDASFDPNRTTSHTWQLLKVKE